MPPRSQQPTSRTIGHNLLVMVYLASGWWLAIGLILYDWLVRCG